MKKLGKLIDERDNVITAVSDCIAGDEIIIKLKGREISCTCNQDIPFGHKIAIVEIKKGEKIIKYGETIGVASQNIKKGDWVHTHNLKDDYIVLDKEGKPLPGQ